MSDLDRFLLYSGFGSYRCLFYYRFDSTKFCFIQGLVQTGFTVSKDHRVIKNGYSHNSAIGKCYLFFVMKFVHGGFAWYLHGMIFLWEGFTIQASSSTFCVRFLSVWVIHKIGLENQINTMGFFPHFFTSDACTMYLFFFMAKNTDHDFLIKKFEVKKKYEKNIAPSTPRKPKCLWALFNKICLLRQNLALNTVT